MAVPDNYDFRLTDVLANVSGHTADTLANAFANANSLDFNLLYQDGSRDSMREFRDYDEGGTPTPTMSVTPSSLPQFSDTGGSDTVEVTSNTSWNVSSKPSWITVSGASFSGNDPVVTLTASTNTTGVSRTGTVTFGTTSGSPTATDTVTVEQRANPI